MTKQAKAPPTNDKGTPTAPPPPPAWRHYLWLIALALFIFLFFTLPTVQTKTVTLNYSQFLQDVSSRKVKTVTIETDGDASGTLKNGSQYTTVIPPQAGQSLLTELQKDGVQITAASSGTSFGDEVLVWVILLAPFLILGYLWWRLSRGGGGAGRLQGTLGVGRAKAKVFDEERPTTTFADVAGYEGAKFEIQEVVDFLRHPERYQRAGATAPRGVLMVGPPGTGKTLLARAVAGEADVPFFSVTGSSFVEMFVGVGAARVRDLFSEARKRAPAIIFVDEVDAIGQRRSGTGAIVSNDEREQTLNQLLAEMDGFDPAIGIIVLAATNRPEVLDPALLRPGRFDRQIVIPLPNVNERAAILAVHCRDKHLENVDIDAVARATPGFSGADLANLANEAAIVAVRDDREVLVPQDFDEARDRIILGRREGSNVLLDEEKHAVAVHEAGHALVAVYSDNADPIAKVTILPAGQSLGVTEQLPLVERHLYGEDYLYDTLAVFMGGRASELVVLGQGSTGAANDLAKATELATKMVREFGLSRAVGPVGYPSGGAAYLDGGSGGGFTTRPFAEHTQSMVDDEVARLLREAEARATDILNAHRDVLDQVVTLLQTNETVDGSDVYRLAGRPEPSGSKVTLAPDRGLPATTHEPVASPVGDGVEDGKERVAHAQGRDGEP